MHTSACGFLKWLTASLLLSVIVVFSPSVLFGLKIVSCSQEKQLRT